MLRDLLHCLRCSCPENINMMQVGRSLQKENKECRFEKELTSTITNSNWSKLIAWKCHLNSDFTCPGNFRLKFQFAKRKCFSIGNLRFKIFSGGGLSCNGGPLNWKEVILLGQTHRYVYRWVKWLNMLFLVEYRFTLKSLLNLRVTPTGM